MAVDSDTITLTSTTDTLADVQSAMGVKAEDGKAAETAAAVATPSPEEVAAAKAVEDAKADEAKDADAVAAKAKADAEAKADEDDDKEAPQAAGGKAKGKLQKRIDELVADRDKHRGITSAQQTELDALRKRVEELVGVTAKPATEAVKPEQKAKPKVDDFPTYEEWTEALAEWKADSIIDARLEAKLKERADKDQATAYQRAQDEAIGRYNEQVTAARAAHDDYDEVVNRPDLKLSKVMMDGMMASQKGAEIAYYLGKNQEACERIAKMGNTLAAALEMGKIEYLATQPAAKEEIKVADAAPAVKVEDKPKPVPEKPKPVATKAPDPIVPVGAGASDSTVNPDQMTHQEFRAWRMKQIRQAQGLA